MGHQVLYAHTVEQLDAPRSHQQPAAQPLRATGPLLARAGERKQQFDVPPGLGWRVHLCGTEGDGKQKNVETLAALLSFAFVLAIACCDRFSRTYPTNYVALFAFTACEAVVLAITCLFVDAVAVGLAAAMTALVTAGLTYYAWKTSADFTGLGGYLYAALLTLVVGGFVGGFFSAFYSTPWIQNLYAVGGCLLFSCYIVYDTQLIVGGQHKKHQFGMDDYVFAALNIYLDIINLFVYLLRLLNSRRD